jgi:hypothetical protein
MDPNLIAMRDKLCCGTPIDSFSDRDLELLAVHLRECGQKFAAQRRFDEAHEFTTLAQHARDELALRSLIPSNGDWQIRESEKLIETQKSQVVICRWAISSASRRLTHRFEQQLADFDKETRELRAKLDNRQRAEFDKFIDRWDTEMPERYRKSSRDLLDLKYVEKNLVISGDYLAAKEVRKRIEEQERREVEAQQNQLDDDFRAATVQLEKEQHAEMARFDSKRVAARQVLERNAEQMARRQENRMNVVSQKAKGMRRSAPSEQKERKAAYGTSFIHVARDNDFDIEAQLPKLRSPTGRRRMRINGATARKGIPFRPPRAYRLRNEAVTEQAKPFFETQIGEGKFTDSDPSPKSQPFESQKAPEIPRSRATEEGEADHEGQGIPEHP